MIVQMPGGGNQVAEGQYDVEIKGCELKVSKKGAEYLNWRFQTLGSGLPLYYSTMLSGPGSGMLKSFVKMVLGHSNMASFETNELVGKKLKVTVGKREGSQFLGVTQVLPYADDIQF